MEEVALSRAPGCSQPIGRIGANDKERPPPLPQTELLASLAPRSESGMSRLSPEEGKEGSARPLIAAEGRERWGRGGVGVPVRSGPSLTGSMFLLLQLSTRLGPGPLLPLQ